MELLPIYIIGGIIIVLLFVIIFRKSTKGSTEDFIVLKEYIKHLQDELRQTTKNIENKLTENNRDIKDDVKFQFTSSQKLIKDITEKLGEVTEANNQVFSMAEQLQDLQNILKNPKQRGVLGEYFLETLLKNVLPVSSYQMQYEFKDGNKVDAVVFIDKKVIPIDSKFSLENYNRLMEATDKSEKERLEKLFLSDLKFRIVETSKYIKPSEGTMDFAFMFIPHEAIYYDLLVNKIGFVTEDSENLLQRAAGKYKVIIVSPTSFLAYLQTVMQGLKAMHIEEASKDIVKRVGELGVHLKKYEEYHNKLGNSLNTVFNHYTDSSKELKKVDKDVLRITKESIGIEPTLLDKPSFDEE